MLIKSDAGAPNLLDHLTPTLLPSWVVHTPRRARPETPAGAPRKVAAGAPPLIAQTVASRQDATPGPASANVTKPARRPDVVPQVTVRNAVIVDIEGIQAVLKLAYPNIVPYAHWQLQRQMEAFPAGQFVVELGGRIIGHAATFRIAEHVAFASHGFLEITGRATGARHDPNGDWLYGMEVAVDPKSPNWRAGGKVCSAAVLLVEAAKDLCRQLALKGLVGGARMPGLKARWDEVGSAEAYLEQFKARKLRDPVLSFHVRHGYELLGVLANYVPYDKDCLGYAALVAWRTVPRERQDEASEPISDDRNDRLTRETENSRTSE